MAKSKITSGLSAVLGTGVEDATDHFMEGADLHPDYHRELAPQERFSWTYTILGILCAVLFYMSMFYIGYQISYHMPS